ncbi:MAG: Segregation and condensation protein B [Parcubacteria group bacterium ADurb.Bin326]|nr:MAG: Segregation and condensation protein B [Parcubacteria group bacterium ADurb.Bin326]
MNEIKNKIESLLFISHKPLSVAELAKLVGSDKSEIETSLESLREDYAQKAGGIELIKLEDKYQLATVAANSELTARFLKIEATGELTRPSLEALTIIAYRGPISKAELELIRGVNCSIILRNLLIRGLIEMRDDKVKATNVYQITVDFLKYLGISEVSQLPDYERLNRNNNLDKLLAGLSGNPVETTVDEAIETTTQQY